MTFHNGSNTFVNHVHLIVKNLEQSKTFYEDILGFEVLDEEGETARLTADGKQPLITIEQNETALPKTSGTTGLFHFAILLPSRNALGDFLHHLIKMEWPVQGGADHQFSEAIYLSDPDGHGIEVYADRAPEVWAWQDGELPLISDPLDTDSLLKTGDKHSWTGLPEQTVMGHIHLHVADLREAKDFYCNGLGFDITIPFRHRALFISTEGYHHHIGLNTWQGEGTPAPASNRVRMKSFSMMFSNQEERQRTVQQLKEIGASVTEDDGVVMTTDPSENIVLLCI